MIELTEQQRQALAETNAPVRVVDPQTKCEYFLVRAAFLEGLQSELAMDDFDPREALDGEQPAEASPDHDDSVRTAVGRDGHDL